jgi:hypothetical protein
LEFDILAKSLRNLFEQPVTLELQQHFIRRTRIAQAFAPQTQRFKATVRIEPIPPATGQSVLTRFQRSVLAFLLAVLQEIICSRRSMARPTVWLIIIH